MNLKKLFAGILSMALVSTLLYFPSNPLSADDNITRYHEWNSAEAFNQGSLTNLSIKGDSLSLVSNTSSSITKATNADFAGGNLSQTQVAGDQVSLATEPDTLNFRYHTGSSPSITGNNSHTNSFLDPTTGLLYVGTNAGLSVIDTKGTIDPTDDTLHFRYHTGSAPALANDNVQFTFLDTSSNLLYISTLGGGLSVIDTKGTIDPTDDTFHFRYHTGSTPALASNTTYHVSMNTSMDLIYVSTSAGLSVIDTKGTIDPTDDTLNFRYHTGSTPALVGGLAYRSFFSPSNSLLYISTLGGGLSVIDTKGTIDPTDDILSMRYHLGSTPALVGSSDNSIFDSWQDSGTNFLYVSTSGGLSVIDTKGTIDPTDDTLHFRYHTGSTPALASDSTRHSFLNTTNGFLYVSTLAGVSVIDTKGTIDPTDDTFHFRYHTGSNPGVTQNATRHSWYNLAMNLLYISTGGGGLSVINLGDLIFPSGTYTSPSLFQNILRPITLSWQEVKAAGQTISLETRLKTAIPSGSYAELFDDGDTSNFGDPYGYQLFSTLNEENGDLTIAREDREGFQSEIYGFITTGPDTFVAGSEVVINVRSNLLPSNSSPLYFGVYDGDYNSGTEIELTSNFQELTFTAVDDPFQNLNFHYYSDGGSVTSEEGVEIESITITGPTLGDPAYVANFFDGNTSNIIDSSDLGFVATESEGILSINPGYREYSTTFMYAFLQTGESFGAESTIKTRVKLKEGSESMFVSVFEDAEDSGIYDVLLTDEFQEIEFNTETEFEVVGFYFYRQDGQFLELTDGIVVDFITIDSFEVAWTPWTTPCTTAAGCLTDSSPYSTELQYRFTLTTNNPESTPAITSVSIETPEYVDSGTYVSEKINLPQTPPTAFVSNVNIPDDTTLDLEYSLNEGVTWLPMDAGTFALSIPTGTQYFQFRATFETTDPLLSPSLVSASLIGGSGTLVTPPPPSRGSSLSSRPTSSRSDGRSDRDRDQQREVVILDEEEATKEEVPEAIVPDGGRSELIQKIITILRKIIDFRLGR